MQIVRICWVCWTFSPAVYIIISTENTAICKKKRFLFTADFFEGILWRGSRIKGSMRE